MRKLEFDILFVISFFSALFSSGYVFRSLPSPFEVNNVWYDILGILLFMGYTIALGVVFMIIYYKFKPKVVDFFNTPKRVAILEQQIALQNTLMNPNLEILLKQIAEDYKTLDNKKMPTIITDLFQRLAILEEKVKVNQFPCNNCKATFEALPQDHIYTLAMREKCSVCDMLNLILFKREIYQCKKCSQINYIFWHHKDEHTIDENRMAEKMFFGKSD